jgi:hypothetical protein
MASAPPKCSNCGTPISGEAGFGMVMCEKCGNLVMLDSTNAPSTETAPSSQSISEPLPEPPSTPQETPSALFQDVVDFGNVDQPANGHGALVYDLKIQGVDTLEIREEVSLCLTDSRLQLDVTSLMKQIEKGVLQIKQINPVKASVILTRMRHLPLKISWTSLQLIKTIAFLILALGISTKTFAAGGDDYSHHESDLKGYAFKIAALQDELRGMIQKKDHNTDPTLRDKMLDDIKKKYDEIQKTYDMFRREKEHVIYEHPEQGDETERTYRHVKVKSLDELEKESGIDGQLTRVKHKVERAYPKAVPTVTPQE